MQRVFRVISTNQQKMWSGGRNPTTKKLLRRLCARGCFGEELLFRGIFHEKLELLFGFFPAASIVAPGMYRRAN